MNLFARCIELARQKRAALPKLMRPFNEAELAQAQAAITKAQERVK
jgi:hypothetical protein